MNDVSLGTTSPEASMEGEAPAEVRRVLLVADERLSGNDLVDELQFHLNGDHRPLEMLVIAPSLAGSAIQHEMADFDGPIEGARERLGWILRELDRVGIQATGEVGDGDPTVAVGDGLREFGAGEIVVVGHAEGHGRTYGEKDLWTRLEREFAVPITGIMVDHPEGEELSADVVSIRHGTGQTRLEDDELLASRNFPPLRRRDIIAILVAMIGTFLLGLLAVTAGLDYPGDLRTYGPLGRGAIIVLIAIGAFLINIASVVALILFQSVGYDGIWKRFTFRFSLTYTSVGLVAALLLLLA